MNIREINKPFIRIDYQEQFLKIGQISGMYYTVPGRKTKRIVIYGIGAPLPPDEGKLSDAAVILDHDTDLFVPDYIGYGRSDGRFTPYNCVKTFLDLYDAFTKGTTATCKYLNMTKHMQYDEVHCMGRSFGAIYVLLLPKFNREIKNICSIFPVADWSTQGRDKKIPEETVEGFLAAMTGDGYKYLYRGILNKSWNKHFEGKDRLNPIDNIKYLKEAKVFIGHGKKDINIFHGHSVRYFKKLIKTFPKNKEQYQLALYPYDHSRKTSNRTIIDYFSWQGIPDIRTKIKK